MKNKKQRDEDKESAKGYLREVVFYQELKDAPVYTLVRSVSKSGMSRVMSVFVCRDNNIIDITWHVANALEWSMSKDGRGIKVSGCGMDMGFHLVYTLSHVLYRDAGLHGDAGYILKHKWL